MNVISENIVQTSEHFRSYYTLIVEKCVQLRKNNKETIMELSFYMGVNRRYLSDFEKLKRFDIILANNVLEYYNYELNFFYK